MPGTVVGKSLNLGFAGRISRNNDNIVRARLVKSILDGSLNETLSPIGFGDPVILNTDNTYSRWGQTGAGVSASTAATFAGFAIAEVKQMTTYIVGSGSGQSGSYLPTQACDVLKRGTITVFCKDTAPSAGSAVYICTVAGGPNAVGDVVTSVAPSGGGTAIVIPNCEFTSGKVDANYITEVTIMNMVNP